MNNSNDKIKDIEADNLENFAENKDAIKEVHLNIRSHNNEYSKEISSDPCIRAISKAHSTDPSFNGNAKINKETKYE